MEEEGSLLRARKIRIVPTPTQRKQLEKTFGIHRCIYNQCVAMEREGEIRGSGTVEKYRVRSLLTREKDFAARGEEWKKDAPSHARQQAVEEFFRAKKAAMSNVR